MNQKDYKEIARIISMKCGAESNTTVLYRKFLGEQLADYFEKEYQESLEKNMGKIYGKGQPIPQFNKEQFLKDCGVK